MPQIRKILLPVDFSAASTGAARYAEILAGRFEAELILLHVTGMDEHNTAGQLLPLSRAKLDAFLSEDLSCLRTQRVCVAGENVAQEIEKAIQEWQPDLVMVPTHGLGVFRRLVLGSVTTKLLHDLAVPVWTSVHAEQAPRLEDIHCRKILCALDLTGRSRYVLEWAAWLAAQYGATLGIVHAIPPWPAAYEGGYPADLITGVAEAARKRLETLLGETGLSAELFVETGNSPNVVSRTADRWAADLLVMGRHLGPGFAGDLFQRTYSIIRDSPCPVISV